MGYLLQCNCLGHQNGMMIMICYVSWLHHNLPDLSATFYGHFSTLCRFFLFSFVFLGGGGGGGVAQGFGCSLFYFRILINI